MKEVDEVILTKPITTSIGPPVLELRGVEY